MISFNDAKEFVRGVTLPTENSNFQMSSADGWAYMGYATHYFNLDSLEFDTKMKDMNYGLNAPYAVKYRTHEGTLDVEYLSDKIKIRWE